MGVVVRRDGVYLSRWDGEIRQDVETRLEEDDLIRALSESCELEEGLTLRHLMEHVRRDELVTTFIRVYATCGPIEEFHARLDVDSVVVGDDGSNLEFLEVYRHVDFHEAKPGERSSFTLAAGFHGVGAPGTNESRGEEGREHYSVSCTPLEEILDLRLELNPSFKLWKWPYAARRKDYKPPELLLEAETGFTLLEVLEAIYDDISFHGGPADSAEFIEEMKQRVEECKENRDRGIPGDVFFDGMEELSGRVEAGEDYDAVHADLEARLGDRVRAWCAEHPEEALKMYGEGGYSEDGEGFGGIVFPIKEVPEGGGEGGDVGLPG